MKGMVIFMDNRDQNTEENVLGKSVFQNAPWQVLSGSALKWIAVVTMLIDHVAMALVNRAQYPDLYHVMRSIGRLAFPIYCFLLIEGFVHTRNVWKYALCLGAFAVISEIPYDLVRSGVMFAPEKQNIFFTLLLGLIMMELMHWKKDRPEWQLIFGMGACGIAQLCNMDYGMFGILQIAGLYFCRFSPLLQQGFLIIINILQQSLQIYGACAAILIACYNGKRGKQLKYFFYLIYPVHLFIIYILRELLWK